MGRIKKTITFQRMQPAPSRNLTSLAAADAGGAETSATRATMRAAARCVQRVEDAARAEQEASDTLVDALVRTMGIAALNSARRDAPVHLASVPAVSSQGRAVPIPLGRGALLVGCSSAVGSPDAAALPEFSITDESRAEIAAAVRKVLGTEAVGAPQVEAVREALHEVVQLNAMYIAFVDTALGRLDVLDEALRAQPGPPSAALVAAYPPDIRTRFKQTHPRLGRCKTAVLYRSMVATDRRSLLASRQLLQTSMAPLQQVLPQMDELQLAQTLDWAFTYLNRSMRTVAQDLLTEHLTAFWCVDVQQESRRLLPTIIGLQLELLDPFLSLAQSLQRIRLPNLEHFIEAAPPLPARPARRVNKLADLIASDGAKILQMRAETAQKALAADAEPRAIAVDKKAAGSQSASTQSTTSSGSDSEDEDIYALRKLAPTPAMPRDKAGIPRRLRYAKQQAPSVVSSTGASRGSGVSSATTSSDASFSSEASTSADASASQPALGRHKAKHRSERALPEANVASDGGPADAPTVHLSRAGADTLRRLMAPSYQQKVKKDDYLKLLREFAELNGPQGTGYIKRVRQASGGRGNYTSAALRFNGSHENIWFQRYDDQWVAHSFHYPHGRGNHVELPKEMLHDYRNVFNAFGIRDVAQPASL